MFPQSLAWLLSDSSYKLYQLAQKTCTMYNKLKIRLLILHRTKVSYQTIHSTAKLSHNILQIAVFFIYVHLKTLLAGYWQNWRVHIEHTCGKIWLTAPCTNAHRSVFCNGSINCNTGTTLWIPTYRIDTRQDVDTLDNVLSTHSG